MSGMPGPLPTELYRDILQHVTSKRDLCALTTTCRDIQTEAEYFLYRSIDSVSPAITKKICSTVINAPRLHHQVRSVSIGCTNEPDDTLQNEHWSYVAGLLSRLTRLDELKIYNAFMNANWVLAHCAGSLKTFHSNFYLDKDLNLFLRRQRNLSVLHWTGYFSGSRELLDSLIPKDPHMLPALTELMTNSPTFALQVMQGRNLTHVWISGPCGVDADSWLDYMARFGEVAGTIKSLRMNLPGGKRGLIIALEILARQAPELRSIGFLPAFTSEDQDIVDAISNFRHLENIVTWILVTAETHRALSRACPTLRFIACLHYSYSREYVLLPVNPTGHPQAVHDPEFMLWRGV